MVAPRQNGTLTKIYLDLKFNGFKLRDMFLKAKDIDIYPPQFFSAH